MIRKIIVLLLIPVFLFGCATLNFSSKYYNPPKNYKDEVKEIWNNLISKISLKYSYTYKICPDKKIKPAGMPQILNNIVYLPEYFINYVYQYYYNDRKIILGCVAMHELAHEEFNLPVGIPKQHYLTDKAVIENFIKPNSSIGYTISDYFSSLCVASNYIDARKGLIGNFLLSISSLTATTIGIGYVETNDFLPRMTLLTADYPTAKFIFKRSNSSKNR